MARTQAESACRDKETREAQPAHETRALGATIIEEERVDISRYVWIFVSRWWLMVLFPVIGFLVAYYYSNAQDPVYEAKASILIQYRGGSFSLGADDFTQGNRLAATYVVQVTARPFLAQLEQAEVGFDIGQLRGMISASRSSNPPVVELNVRHGDPVVAANVATIAANTFIGFTIDQRFTEIARVQGAATSQGITISESLVAAQLSAMDALSLLDEVTVPGSPVIPRTRQNTTYGVLLGILLAAGIALLLESLGDTLRSPEELTNRFGVTGLGTIFKWDSKDTTEGELIVLSGSNSGYAESFRQIRANIEFATANHPGKVFILSSPGPAEGKSTVVSNLSAAFAQTGRRVVLIDGDMRRPTLHKIFNKQSRQPGLSNFLGTPGVTADDVIQDSGVQGVDLIPSGPTPPNPAELMGSSKMTELLNHLRNVYDMVFVDTPPILLVADTSVLASRVDGAIMVVDGSTTKPESFKAALDTINKSQAHVVGGIVNGLKRPRFGYGYNYPYHYYYYSYYRSYYSSDEPSMNGNRRFYRRWAGMASSAVSRIRRK